MIDPPQRVEHIERIAYWRCEHCGHVKARYTYGENIGVQFCDPCEWQYGVLDPMRPVRTVKA